MSEKKKILAISGSTRKDSTNLQILKVIGKSVNSEYDYQIFEGLADLPHFNPDIDNETPPKEVENFRKLVEESVGVIICTPEYVFSLPGSLKNALEWGVSTTVFSKKKVGLITASASGEMAHEQLILIMKTLEAQLEEENLLLIQGVRGKINEEGKIINDETLIALKKFIDNFENQFFIEM